MKKILFQRLGVFLLVLAVGCGEESKTIFTENDINIVPKTLEMKLNQGAFRFTKDTKLVAANDQTQVFEVLQNKFVSAAGWNLGVVNTAPSSNFVQLSTDVSLPEEAYNLKVTENQVIIYASGHNGFLYGLETIRQLLPVSIESKNVVSNMNWDIPNVEIKDSPRFKWR